MCTQVHALACGTCVSCARVLHVRYDVCDARVPGVRVCARVCTRSLETTAQCSVVRLGSGRWFPVSRVGGPRATFWVSESPGSEPEAPPSPVSPVWAAELPGCPHHRLPACPGGPRLTFVHCLVGTRVSGFLGALRAASDPAPAGLQCERQAGGISPIGAPRPIHGTAVLPARGARDWRDDASSGSFSTGVVTTHAAAVSPQRACWPCCQRARGWEWPELRSGGFQPRSRGAAPTAEPAEALAAALAAQGTAPR